MLGKINSCNSGFSGLESQKVTASEQSTHLPVVHLPYTAAGQLLSHRKSAQTQLKKRRRSAGLMPQAATPDPRAGAAPEGAGVRAGAAA